MNTEQKDQQGILESQADGPTREMLAKARKQTRAFLARKLKVSKETVRRIEKRTDLYLSTLRSYVEGVGGELSLVVKFPDRPPVILAGLGENTGSGGVKSKAKKKAGTPAKSKACARAAPRELRKHRQVRRKTVYKFNQNKDLFLPFRLAETAFKPRKIEARAHGPGPASSGPFPPPSGGPGKDPMPDDQNPLLPLDGGTPPHSGGTNFLPMNIEEEMRRSYLAYSMSVIIGRALPDARDGLKPVHRRILTAMDREGLQHNKRYSKCAGVVGECLKKYHPHGDSSVYDALVRMAQPWSLRYPLVDGQGNFGSVDGDPPAAYRYTECRMERIAEEMMADIDMETVDMMPNFDETTDEPTVLPTRIPTLIVNGSNGIAVGMATNIPPHNLTEVVNAAIALVKDPNAGLEEVLKHVQGPDFPTGGFLYGKSGIPAGLQDRPRPLPDARQDGSWKT